MLRPISIIYFLYLFLSFFPPIIIIFVWQSGGWGFGPPQTKPSGWEGRSLDLLCFAALAMMRLCVGFQNSFRRRSTASRHFMIEIPLLLRWEEEW